MDDTQLTLAPAAGAGLGKKVFENLLADDKFARDVADTYRDCLRATVPPRWDKGKGEWIESPDYRTRLAAIVSLFAQAEGEPIKRVIHQHLGVAGKDVDPLAALQDSPELREALRSILEKAEWRHSGRKASKRPVKPAEVTLE